MSQVPKSNIESASPSPPSSSTPTPRGNVTNRAIPVQKNLYKQSTSGSGNVPFKDYVKSGQKQKIANTPVPSSGQPFVSSNKILGKVSAAPIDLIALNEELDIPPWGMITDMIETKNEIQPVQTKPVPRHDYRNPFDYAFNPAINWGKHQLAYQIADILQLYLNREGFVDGMVDHGQGKNTYRYCDCGIRNNEKNRGGGVGSNLGKMQADLRIYYPNYSSKYYGYSFNPQNLEYSGKYAYNTNDGGYNYLQAYQAPLSRNINKERGGGRGRRGGVRLRRWGRHNSI